MRIVFAGTPDFAAAALRALIDAAPAQGWTIPLVLSQPDRPAGRGMKLTASAVKRLALEYGLAVDTPVTFSRKKGGAHAAQAEAAIERLCEARPDVLVVAAYGLILPPAVLELPQGLRAADGTRITAVNIHASLLPRWRGAAPVARAIEAGDSDTGITLMQMEAGLDTGPMLEVERMAIAAHDTSATLTARLAEAGARLLVQGLARSAAWQPQPQPQAGVTYAHKLDKSEAALDFCLPAITLERKVRAFNPFPGASAVWRGEALKIWAAAVQPETVAAPAGTVLRADAEGIRVACGQGTLLLTEVQRPGARRMAVRDLLGGFPIEAGQRFELAALP